MSVCSVDSTLLTGAALAVNVAVVNTNLDSRLALHVARSWAFWAQHFLCDFQSDFWQKREQ